MMAPMVLKKLALDFEISSQKRLAENRLDRATVQPVMRDLGGGDEQGVAVEQGQGGVIYRFRA